MENDFVQCEEKTLILIGVKIGKKVWEVKLPNLRKKFMRTKKRREIFVEDTISREFLTSFTLSSVVHPSSSGEGPTLFSENDVSNNSSPFTFKMQPQGRSTPKKTLQTPDLEVYRPHNSLSSFSHNKEISNLSGIKIYEDFEDLPLFHDNYEDYQYISENDYL